MKSTSTSALAGRVRRATPADLDAVLPLWRGLLDHHADADPSFALAADVASALRTAASRTLGDSTEAVFVWEHQGALAGLCIAGVVRAPQGVREPARVEISEVVVDPSLRRRGVGRALVRAALTWAEGCGARRVEVRVAVRNAEGQGFWRALGFGDFVDVLERRL